MNELENNLKRGIKHFEKGDYRVAQILLEKFNKVHPQNVEGISYLLQNYTKLIENDSKSRVLRIKIEKLLTKYRQQGFIPDMIFPFIEKHRALFPHLYENFKGVNSQKFFTLQEREQETSDLEEGKKTETNELIEPPVANLEQVLEEDDSLEDMPSSPILTAIVASKSEVETVYGMSDDNLFSLKKIKALNSKIRTENNVENEAVPRPRKKQSETTKIEPEILDKPIKETQFYEFEISDLIDNYKYKALDEKLKNIITMEKFQKGDISIALHEIDSKGYYKDNIEDIKGCILSWFTRNLGMLPQTRELSYIFDEKNGNIILKFPSPTIPIANIKVYYEDASFEKIKFDIKDIRSAFEDDAIKQVEFLSIVKDEQGKTLKYKGGMKYVLIASIASNRDGREIEHVTINGNVYFPGDKITLQVPINYDDLMLHVYEQYCANLLDHPKIPSLYGTLNYEKGNYKNIYYHTVIAQYVPGVTLKSILEGIWENPPEEGEPFLDVNIISAIAKQVPDTIEFLHSKGFVHLDLKPENLMIYEENGEIFVNLIDVVSFNRLFFTFLADPDSIYGTPNYLDFRTQKEGKYDEAGDYYSFGAMIYELFTGNPFCLEMMTYALDDEDYWDIFSEEGFDVEKLANDNAKYWKKLESLNLVKQLFMVAHKCNHPLRGRLDHKILGAQDEKLFRIVPKLLSLYPETRTQGFYELIKQYEPPTEKRDLIRMQVRELINTNKKIKVRKFDQQHDLIASPYRNNMKQKYEYDRFMKTVRIRMKTAKLHIIKNKNKDGIEFDDEVELMEE